MLLGSVKMSAEKVAQAFDQAFKNFVAKKPKHVKQIDVVIFQSQMLNAFQSRIDISQPPPSLHLNSSSSKSNATSRLLSLESDVDPKHRIIICFTSNEKSNIEEVTATS